MKKKKHPTTTCNSHIFSIQSIFVLFLLYFFLCALVLLLKRNDTRSSVCLTKCVCAISLYGCKLRHQRTVNALFTKQSMFYCHHHRCHCSCAFSKLWALSDGGGCGSGGYFIKKKECFKWRENHLPPIHFLFTFFIFWLALIQFHSVFTRAPPLMIFHFSC